ncbi:g4646 [Coccomyxa viridis]|uniref:G4646 protein n=1 Tax=Coccomyxa viridis TaxID=1274662 RepID=A0ABP1FTU9_9CHLO
MLPSRGTVEGNALTLAGYDVEAGSISVAGQETCISIPQLKLIFDTGRCPQRAVYQPHVFLSHSHMDHIGGLPFHVATRAMLGLSPSIVILPESLAQPTQNLLDAYGALDGSTLPCSIVPLAPGMEYKLANNYFVKSFPTVHTVPSQGYVVYSRKQKLRPELAKLPNAEIRDRRLAGEEVTYPVVTPEVAFTGDTAAEVFNSPGFEDALAAKLLIIEATFLEDDISPEHAKSYGHMHISEIAERADSFKNEAILLIHFSQRYSAEAIVEHLHRALPPSLRDKCTPLLQGYS